MTHETLDLLREAADYGVRRGLLDEDGDWYISQPAVFAKAPRSFDNDVVLAALRDGLLCGQGTPPHIVVTPKGRRSMAAGKVVP